MEEFGRYVGLDVHKDTIVGASAYPGRSKPESLGVIANTRRRILRLVNQLTQPRRIGLIFSTNAPMRPIATEPRLEWAQQRRALFW